MPQRGLLALDWGTSSLRAYLLGAGGAVLAARQQPWGILHLPEGGFAAALERIAGDWLAASPAAAGHRFAAWSAARRAGARRPMSTLPGRRQGPGGTAAHVRGAARPCAAHRAGRALRRRAARRDARRGDADRRRAGAPAGAGGAAVAGAAGHAQQVGAGAGRRASSAFHTYMTGELYAVLTRAFDPRPPGARGRRRAADDAAFDRGLAAAAGAAGAGVAAVLGAHAGARTASLPAADSLDYLSGLLIGDELRCALPRGRR